MSKALDVVKNGLFKENPIFKLVLGMCPTLAVTTSAVNGLGMGLSTTFVLIGSNLVISLLRNIIPNKVRIPAYIVVIATFVTLVEMLTHAFMADLYASLGLFIPLIVVNCVILSRAESFASQNNVGLSILDGLSMGLGFTLSLTLLASVREILGNGTIFGINIMGAAYKPALIMILPSGAFIALGLLMGISNYLFRKNKEAA